jgi:hypothetical protein
MAVKYRTVYIVVVLYPDGTHRTSRLGYANLDHAKSFVLDRIDQHYEISDTFWSGSSTQDGKTIYYNIIPVDIAEVVNE